MGVALQNRTMRRWQDQLMAPGSPEIGDPGLLGWRPVRGRRLPPVTLDATERYLVALWLRRYVTWCARTRRYDRVDGAAALYRRLG